MRRLVVPARGGSKGIPKKNLQEVGGRTLIERAITTAIFSSIDEVILSSDNDEILEIGSRYPITVFRRSAETARDDASTESALLEIIRECGNNWTAGDSLGFLQPTSPYLTPNSINACFEAADSGYSAFTAQVDYSFLWTEGDSNWRPLNHPESIRHRRQDLPYVVRETGGCYAFPFQNFQSSGYRFCSSPKPILVSNLESIDIDSVTDLEFARAIKPEHQNPSFYQETRPSLIVTDFDGCLTNDKVELSEKNLESITFSRKDGMAAQILRDLGIPILILSSEKNPVVKLRAKKMGVEVIQHSHDKISTLQNYLAIQNISSTEVWYLGNELNDLAVMGLAGVSFCPNDASPKVKSIATHILRTCGGDGVLLELLEYLPYDNQ